MRGPAPLAPEDLLPHEPAGFDIRELRSLVHGRRALVTGGGGSIGSEIGRQLARLGAAEIVLVDIHENALYLLYRELQARHPDVRIVPEIADIRDLPRMRQLTRTHRPQDVFHAAAHKHVPLLEAAPQEAVKNNVTGCRHVIEAAEAAGVARFVLLSTDKAVRPASVLGATKRLAELMVRARAGTGPTRFTTMRFGNVLGSAGSVVPLFQQQIAAGGPVTVTHPEVRRYLMTVGEAVGLVIQAGLGEFGDLCVLEMGQPVRILDLAHRMIVASGLVPDRDVSIVFTGLRPGEKLDEELLTPEEAKMSRRVTPRLRTVASPPPPADLAARVARLEAAAEGDSLDLVRRALRDAVPEYVPTDAAPLPARPAAGLAALSPPHAHPRHPEPRR
jgi:FlaA1/EpsC-like NDP-sugar epimerase